MAYEVFTRTGVRVETPTLSLTPDWRIALNSAATRILLEAEIKNVLLLWDKQNHKLALKAASKGDKNAYAVSLRSDKGAGTLRAKAFLCYVGWSAPRREALTATWNQKEKMLEVTLPTKFLSTDQGKSAGKEQRSSLEEKL